MNMSAKPIRYDLIDTKHNHVIKSYTNRAAATRAADKKDIAYGAIRYVVQPVWAA